MSFSADLRRHQGRVARRGWNSDGRGESDRFALLGRGSELPIRDRSFASGGRHRTRGRGSFRYGGASRSALLARAVGEIHASERPHEAGSYAQQESDERREQTIRFDGTRRKLRLLDDAHVANGSRLSPRQ
jgi:hypothetical protein